MSGLPSAWRHRLDPDERYGLRLTLTAVALVIVAVPFSTLTLAVLAKGPLTRFDGRVANAANDRVHGHPVAVTTLKLLSGLGQPLVLTAIVVAAVAYLLRHRRTRLAVFLVVTSLGGGLVDTAVKGAVDRPRPVVDHPVATALGKSFPSGHTMSSTIVYVALLVVFQPAIPVAARRWAVAVVGLLVLAIGCSRLLLGVHFVSDVVGGYLLGAAWLAGSVAAFEAWRSDAGWRRSRPLAEGLEPEAAADLLPGEPDAA